MSDYYNSDQFFPLYFWEISQTLLHKLCVLKVIALHLRGHVHVVEIVTGWMEKNGLGRSKI
jgi:hypothetical protein